MVILNNALNFNFSQFQKITFLFIDQAFFPKHSFSFAGMVITHVLFVTGVPQFPEQIWNTISKVTISIKRSIPKFEAFTCDTLTELKKKTNPINL